MNRINFGLFLIFLILINFKIILVNEETLILVCFAVFCFLVMSRLSNSLSDFFSTQASEIKSGFLTSSKIKVNFTKQQQETILISLPWPEVFNILKTEVKQVNSFLFSQFESSYFLSLHIQLSKKLEFSKRLEIQLSKLIITVITEKLRKTSKLHSFCTVVLQIPAVISMNKVQFREHLRKITL